MNDLSHAKAEPADPHTVCGDCMYCDVGPETKQDIMSRCCYRNPPIPMLTQTKQGIAVVSVRPMIRVDTWACGEFDPGDSVEGAIAGVPPVGMAS